LECNELIAEFLENRKKGGGDRRKSDKSGASGSGSTTSLDAGDKSRKKKVKHRYFQFTNYSIHFMWFFVLGGKEGL